MTYTAHRFKPGDHVGRLTLRYSSMSDDGKGRRVWAATCDCGNRTSPRQDYLVKSISEGKDVGCGCVQREIARSGDCGRKHGMTYSPTWISWVSMNRRCYDSSYKSYAAYGGSGISVCEEWRHDFAAFLLDMGVRPIGTTLERRRNTVGYTRDNCRWATKLEQANNKTNNRLISDVGITLTMAEWSRRTTVPYERMKHFLNSGMSPTQVQRKFHPVVNRKRV